MKHELLVARYGRSGVKDVCKEVEGKTEEQVKEYHKVCA